MSTTKLAFTILLLAITTAAWGQEDKSFLAGNAREKDRMYPTFGHQVKIRDHPHLDSAHTELLPLGAEVRIIDQEHEFTWNEHTTSFYMVEYQGKIGYVLGDFIAQAAINFQSDSSITVLARTNSSADSLCFKVYQNQTYLHQLAIPLSGVGISVSSEASTFSSVKEIITVQYSGDYCGAQYGISYVFWDQTNLYHAIDLIVAGEYGEYLEESLIFPKANDTENLNTVIFISESGVMIDEETEEYKIDIKEQKLVWNGKQFVPSL